MKELLTVTEVIDATGLGRTTVNKLMSEGQLRSVKVGARRLVRATTLTEWIESLESASYRQSA